MRVEQEVGGKPWVHSAEIPLTQLAYADDTLVVSRSAQLMETILHHIERMAALFSLKLNEGKCELIRINTENDVHFV